MSFVTFFNAVVILRFSPSRFARKGGHTIVNPHSLKEENRKLNIFEIGNEIHISLNFTVKFGVLIHILFNIKSV